MKNHDLKTGFTFGIGALAGILLLGGCAANLGGNASSEWTPPVKQESSQQASSSENLKNLTRNISYVQDSFSKENYLKLAENYAELGLVRMQRDTLEQGYRLFPDNEFLEQLQNIYVNLAEEDENILNAAETMYQNMELEEYRAESLHLAEDNDWFATMMPKLSVGERNYFQTKDGVNKMAISVGYDENSVKYVRAWFYDTPERVLYVSYSNELAQVMQAELADGKYNGAFELWTLNGADGSIIHEAGTLLNGEASEQEHTVRFHQGKAGGDVFDLWNHRTELKYIDLFGENVKTRSKLSQVTANPNYSVYDTVETETIRKDEPQVRVFDGQIQYLSDKGWISLGNVEDYAAEDPFVTYAEEKKQIDSSVPAAREKEPELKTNTDTQTSTQTSTQTNTQTSTRTTSSQGNTSRPAATPTTPAVTPASAQPAPAPQETTVDDDDDDDDDDDGDTSGNDNGGDSSNDGGGGDNGGDSGNDSGDSGNNGGGDDNGGGAGDDGDNDAEIGWGEDLL